MSKPKRDYEKTATIEHPFKRSGFTASDKRHMARTAKAAKKWFRDLALHGLIEKKQ